MEILIPLGFLAVWIIIAFLEPIAPGLDKQSFLQLLEERIEAATAELIAGALAADPSLKRARARLDSAVS